MKNFIKVNRDFTGMDFVSIIEQVSGITLTRYNQSQYHCKPVYYGQCPFCRQKLECFAVYCGDYQVSYECGQCEAEGDPIQFLVTYCRMTEPEALLALYGESGRKEAEYLFVPQPAEITRDTPPSATWRRQTQLLQEYAIRQLWHTKAGKQALVELRKCGLRDETIKNANLGYIPPNFNAGAYTEWGFKLSDLSPEQLILNYHNLILPEGILYPYTPRPHDIWKLTIRSVSGLTTYTVPGSREGMFNLGNVRDYTQQIVMMVESELDALLVSQLNMLGIIGVATGDSENGRYYKWIDVLSHVALVFQSFCNHPQTSSDAEYWINALPNAMRYPLSGKHAHYESLADFVGDHGEAALIDWIRTGLELVIHWLEKNLPADEEA